MVKLTNGESTRQLSREESMPSSPHTSRSRSQSLVIITTFNLDRIKKNNTRLFFRLFSAALAMVFFPQLRAGRTTVNTKFGIFWYTIKQYLGYNRCLRKFSDKTSRRDFRIWFAAVAAISGPTTPSLCPRSQSWVPRRNHWQALRFHRITLSRARRSTTRPMDGLARNELHLVMLDMRTPARPSAALLIIALIYLY